MEKAPKDQNTLPGFAARYLPKEPKPKNKQEPRSLAGLCAFFLRCFPDQGRFTFMQTRWALQQAMKEHGLTIDDMFLRANRMKGKHPTMSPWELARCDLPERARRPDRKAPEDVTDTSIDTTDVAEGTRDEVLKILRRQEEEWVEEQL